MDDLLECMEALGHDLYEMVDILHEKGPEVPEYNRDEVVRSIIEKNKRLKRGKQMTFSTTRTSIDDHPDEIPDE
jgi:hypothetical protein